MGLRGLEGKKKKVPKGRMEKHWKNSRMKNRGATREKDYKLVEKQKEEPSLRGSPKKTKNDLKKNQPASIRENKPKKKKKKKKNLSSFGRRGRSGERSRGGN